MKMKLKEIWKYRHLMLNLIQRDLKVKYRRSVLGFAWSILNPLLMMLVITAVFENIFQHSIENYPIYYLTGYLLFSFNSEATNGAMTSIITSAPLIKKVYVPKAMFPVEKALFAFVNMVLSFVAVIIVMLILRQPFTWTFFMFWIPLLYCLVFSIGLGLILAAANVFFRDTAHLYSVLVIAWMYMTPIFYPVDMLTGVARTIMSFNPMHHFVMYFRAVVMYNHIPDLRTNLICAGFALISLVVGVLFFKKTQDKFILYV